MHLKYTVEFWTVYISNEWWITLQRVKWIFIWSLLICACVLSHFSHVQLFATPWTVDHEAPLSMGFSRQEYWSGLSFPSPGDLPNQGIQPTSFMSPALAGGFFTPSNTWEARSLVNVIPNCSFSNYIS